MPCYLWLIRHGKAQDHSRGSGDHDRDLAPRGERDGVLIADWLAHQSHPAEWIWSSSALRTQRTSAIVAQAFGGQVIESSDLYLAHPNDILECVKSTPPDISCAAVVGHNPGLSYLTSMLGNDSAINNLPTFGCVLLHCTGEWTDIGPHNTRLEQHVTPKALR